ncbi:hypothetical protein [Rhodosalinus halophilus]|uniref:hypothetical protein n=1 Tax=Rhodosalinus halophilus TaxID=2259333 RepID=UPI00131501E4|nr:hypothetical protein [Rhodosalinus halophilus]
MLVFAGAAAAQAGDLRADDDGLIHRIADIEETLATDAQATGTPGAGLADPKLAAGLDAVMDWSVQQPFIDRMKTARPWIGHTADEWGRWDAAALEAGGHVSAEGWPLSLPEGATKLESLVLTDQPEEAEELAGRYILRWTGEGHLEVGGRARLVAQRPGEIVFNYTPGPGAVTVEVKSTDPEGTGDHIRDISLVREDHLALHEAGALFNPSWLALVRDLRAVRFMNWMDTNGSTLVRWEDRPRPEDMTWSVQRHGVPVEVMVALANEIGADPWFTLPHLADDDFVRRFAEHVRDTLDPRLRVHAEYSNELWNQILPQAQWARAQAEARWGDAADDAGWMQFAGGRAAQVADIWREVFGPEADARLRTVVGVQTGWLGLEKPLLEAPLWVAEGNPRPAESFDLYAVTGYFGYEMGTDDWAPRIKDWLEREGAAETTARVAEALRAGSLAALIEERLPYHARVAADHGMEMVMYEGGTHVVGIGPWVEDRALTAFFTQFNYSPEMGALYERLLAGWRESGGTLFNAFVEVGGPSRFGSWGALRHLWDDNPRWDALMAYNASAAPWEERAPGTFLHGVLREGGPGADELRGTPEEDTLIGGPGDDRLDGRGGADRLHGGPGTDRAVLPGSAAAWLFRTEGEAVIAESDSARVRMVAVEEVVFAADDDLVFLTASLRQPR